MTTALLAPIGALRLGLAVLHEPIRPQAFGGMAMIGLSLAAIDSRIPARLARMSKPAPAL